MRARLRLLALAILAARPAAAGFTERVSVGVGGVQNGGGAFTAAVSSDGSLVAFETFGFITNLPGGNNGTFIRDRAAGTTTFLTIYQMSAFTPDFATAAFSNSVALVPDDTNNIIDVYALDVMTSAVERVSVASDASQGNGRSDSPSISADGRLVAFRSVANNLVMNDTNARDDIFVHDRLTGMTERVSVAFDGSQSDGPSDSPVISGDGRFAAFASLATNLVAGGTDGQRYVFVHDRMTGTTELASILPDDSPGSDPFYGPALSADGSLVAFDASDQVYARDRVAGATELVSATSGGMPGNGSSGNPAISADGRLVTFESVATDLVPGDTNGSSDVFLRDRRIADGALRVQAPDFR